MQWSGLINRKKIGGLSGEKLNEQATPASVRHQKLLGRTMLRIEYAHLLNFLSLTDLANTPVLYAAH